MGNGEPVRISWISHRCDTGDEIIVMFRWWAPDNVYAKENGGDYDFIIESNTPFNGEKGPFALPNDDKFWLDFFDDVKTWGVESYLQVPLQI